MLAFATPDGVADPRTPAVRVLPARVLAFLPLPLVGRGAAADWSRVYVRDTLAVPPFRGPTA